MSKNIQACYSRNTDDWKTPTEIYNYFINKLGCIDCFKYQDAENELEKNYKNSRLFVNPPFSKMNDVTKWLIRQLEWKRNNTIFLLIPARTDTKYFHELIKYRPTIMFIKGRLHYNDSKSAPFPTILMMFDKLKISIYAGIEQNSMK